MIDLAGALAPHVERDDLAAVVAAIEHPGAPLQLAAFGAPRDAIFRISSMTKPIVAAAAMRLVELDRLDLDAPIARWLPELAAPRVLRRPDAALDDTEPAHRAITVRDVLTYTAGIGMSADFSETPLVRAERALDLRSFAPPIPATPLEADEWLARLATLPFLAQPGARWLYNTCGTLAGLLVARAAEQPLAIALQEHVLAPLGMRDTAFFVPPSQLDRFTPLQDPDGVLDPADGTSQWARPPSFADGAAGLVSTLDDLLAFHRMLARRGGGLLRPATVELMTRDHLTAAQRAGMEIFLGDRSWGLGLAIGPTGRVGWDGGLGTSAAADLRTGLVGVVLTSRMFTTPEPPGVIQAFWGAADKHLHDDRRGSTWVAGS